MGRTGFYQWLSSNPPILYYAAPSDEDIGERLPEYRIYRLPIYHWHRTADDVERYHVRAKANRPRHVLHHLINERDLALELQARGIPATFTSQNAMLDERLFTVHTGPERLYDAVYNARMTPFKRHTLARDVSSLLVIGGVFAPNDHQGYFDQVKAQMPRACFTFADGKSWIREDQIAAALNTARVGLCLSSCEGAMYSATEYLLCGLPVVSTVSLGGRDEWFDTKYVRVVRDEPPVIAEAVRDLISLKLPPHWIRQQALARLWRHRTRFLKVGQSIFDREQVGKDFAREFYGRFYNKMGRWRDHSELMQFIGVQCENN